MIKREFVDYTEKYRKIYEQVENEVRLFGLNGSEAFCNACAGRVMCDADEEWSDSDVRIAIINTLNELIEKM